MSTNIEIPGLDEIRLVVREEIAAARIERSPWLNVDAAADYLGTSADAIYGRVKRGELIPTRSKPRLLFERAELDRWVRSQ